MFWPHTCYGGSRAYSPLENLLGKCVIWCPLVYIFIRFYTKIDYMFCMKQYDISFCTFQDIFTRMLSNDVK